MDEKNIKINNIDITYCYRKGKYDCRHLVVIFSGFGASNKYTYDFKGKSLDNVPSHILWIKDSFYNDSCYYLCHKMDFSIEKAVNDFILNFCHENFLDIENITLVGGSKGGTAALYFGIKYNYTNIISSAPQIYIGSFLKKIHKDVANHMLKCDDDVYLLDNIIKKEIENSKNINKNIYLISSPVDQYETCMEIHKYLTKFINFNHIITYSPCCQQHNQITSYNLPIILSIILSLSQKIYPKLGEWFCNGRPSPPHYETEILLKRQYNEQPAVAYLESCSFNNGRCFPEGVAYFRGIPSPEYGLFKKNIIITNNKYKFVFQIGSMASQLYSRNFFNDVYCDYKTIGFASMQKKGISLENIPVGKYNIFISIKGNNLYSEVPLQMLDERQYISSGHQNIYRITEEEKRCILQVIPAISSYSPDICIVTKKWIREKFIHYEGNFLKYGIEIKEWKDVIVYIIFKNQNFIKIYNYGKNSIPELNNSFDTFGIYEKSNFCSIHRNGVDISDFPDDIYEVFITFVCKGCILSQSIDKIIIKNNKPEFKLSE